MKEIIYDIIIIGGGPAGLTAGLYASRARLNVFLLETLDPSGQAVVADRIENYPGFPEGTNGFELIEKFKKQAQQFGLEIIMCKATGIEKSRDWWKVIAEDKEYSSLAVIVATGAKPKELGVSGEKEFLGKGVSYCATCDGVLFRDKDIVVVGGGDTAIEEALFLTRFARKLTLIHRRNRLRATKILQERILANKKIEIMWDSIATEVSGKDKVEGVKIKNLKTQEESSVQCEGIFIFVGLTPNTGFLNSLVELDKNGYIVTTPNMETSQKGIFACGDCTKKLLRQVITAAGDGATAAFSCQQYVEELKGLAYK